MSDGRKARRGATIFLAAMLLAAGLAGGMPAPAKDRPVTYAPADASAMSTADLGKYYAWRNRMDWLLAPIHTRADLERYLKATATAGSPLDVLSPDERTRFLSQLEFGPHGAFIAYFGDLQYLSTRQVYRILALFGEQRYAMEFTGGRIRLASPRAAPQSGEPSLIERRFAEYLKAYQRSPGETDAELARKVGQVYAQWFAPMQTPDSVRKIGSHDLRLLFRAAGIATSASRDARYARDARLDFLEMEKRHFAGWPDYQEMYQSFIETRQFAAAHDFYKSHPDIGLTPFPAYRDGAANAGKRTPTVLVVSTTKRELVRRPVDLDKPALVVVLIDPACHFCAAFERDLRSHPKLREALAGHVLWLTPPTTELEFDSLQAWDRAHPGWPVNIMYSAEGWPMKNLMGTPEFFFLNHGRVVAKHIGWTGEKDFPAIRKDLKAIGLWRE